jgi:hypothetical protein
VRHGPFFKRFNKTRNRGMNRRTGLALTDWLAFKQLVTGPHKRFGHVSGMLQ